MKPTAASCPLRVAVLCFALSLLFSVAQGASYPRLMADSAEIARAKQWIRTYPWYQRIFETNRRVVDRFLAHGPIFVSPIKQTYQYQWYSCPKHDADLLYEEFRPHEHRCSKDTTEIYRGAKYDAAWSGWYNRRLASHLVWMGLLWQTTGEEKYAQGGREILLKFADLYLQYPTENTILGPAHVFFGTLSESFWGVDMAYGYDLLYRYPGFSAEDRSKIREKLFYPLAKITQQFPESASNRQLWYNNVSAAVGFLFDDRELIDFALKGTYGFQWQLGSALPESGFWPEWSGYHYVALRGMIHLAEMARHNGLDLYHLEIAGRTMKKMFDAPFTVILPNLEFPRSKDSGGGKITEYATFYEIGYSVYRDSLYLALLNRTNLQRGKQIVGEESGAGETENPITLFNLVPELPSYQADVYPGESVNLEGTGFAVLRNGSGDDRRYLYLDYGIMGGEHGHPDRLQLGYYALGRNWIVDPLNEHYFNPNLQLWYRQTIAHNTVVLDQTSQTWTNGQYRYFEALPGLQVASGFSETAYPGATLTRTLVQAGDYFIDLFDVRCRERRIIDWPMHAFGKLHVTGPALHAEPPDRFGKQPGIPGYDQLTDIASAVTDDAWTGTFEDTDGQRMLVRAIGEKGTQVFTMTTPRLGGFYKQMVTEPQPMPMLMSRRVTDATRFAHLFQVSGSTPSVTAFESTGEPGTYRVVHDGNEDLVHADPDSLRFWLLRVREGRPRSLTAFHISKVEAAGRVLLWSTLTLKSLECSWQGDSLLVRAPSPIGEVRIQAPGVRAVLLNGEPIGLLQTAEGVVIREPHRMAFELSTPVNDTLFLGMGNAVTVRVVPPSARRGSAGGGPASTAGTPGAPVPVPGIVLPNDWRERVESQLRWWGGVVNLKATNKGPLRRTLSPREYRQDASWLTGARAQKLKVPAGSPAAFTIPVNVPGDAPPADYVVNVVAGRDTVACRFHVSPPVRAEILMPNGREQALDVRLYNLTGKALDVRADLSLDRAWKTTAPRTYRVQLAGKAGTSIVIPLELAGYNPANQLYPVRLRIRTGGYAVEIVRDIYAGLARRAGTRPSLDGSWQGWDTTRPMTIDRESQVGRLLLGNQRWNGRGDLSAKVFAMYDDSALYVGADVTDDSLITHWNFPVMSYPWDTDCMEVVLDTRTGSTQETDPPTPGLFRHLSMAEHRLTEFDAEHWQGGGAGGPTLPKPLLVPGAETFFSRRGNGYALVCRYPASALGVMRLQAGAKIGFDVAVSDNDGTTYRKNQHIWAGYSQNQSWWDMATIGVLLLR